MDTKAAGGASEGRVVKRALDADQAARIAAEAEVLSAAQIPGVVELVGVDEGAEWPSLVTARVDGPDLGRAHDLSVEEVAGVAAAVATVLADIHDLGLVHGAVIAAHVVVGPDGRPVLCGFGHGGRAGEPPVAEAVLAEGCGDPARRPGDPLAPSADVYGLGVLLRALASEAAGAAPRRGPLPARLLADVGRRLCRPVVAGAVRRGRGGDRSAADALVAVADRATTTDPHLRLGARSLAAAVRVAVPGARLPRRLDPVRATEPVPAEASALEALRRRGIEAPPGVASPAPRRVVLVAGLAAAAAAFVVVRLVSSAPPASVSQPARPDVPVDPLSAQAGALPTTAVAGTPAAMPPALRSGTQPAAVARPDPACPAPNAPLAADTDADGCPEALRWSDGVVEAGDRRWSVGQPGDRVATADWSCSGRATLALLRPTTGEVFVFDGWAGADDDLVAQLVGRVEGGFAIRAADLGDGCPRVAVDRGDAAPVTLARRRP